MNPSHSAPAVLLVSRYCLVTVLTLGSVGATPSANAAPSANPSSVAAALAPEPAPASAAPASPAAEPGSRPSQKFELTYTAPDECPTRQEFIAWTDRFYAAADAAEPATGGSSEADWRAAPDEVAGSIQIRVIREGSQYTARLLMVSAGGQCPTVRPPHTETSCADAARAMAYSLAQALRAPPCAVEVDLPKPASARPSAPPCAPSPRACPRASTRAPSPTALRGELGVGAGLVTPLAEDIAWGGVLLVGFTTASGSPSGRLAVGYWDAGTVPMGHDLRARLWSVGVSLCPFRVGFTSWLSLPLCATGEIGPAALSGVGSVADEATDDEAAGSDDDRANLYLWSSLGVSARLRAENSWLFAELEPNLVFPLFYHPVYVHQPSSEASERQDAGQVGQWGALKAHLNLGIVFP